ncbi:VanZ family protein [Flavobacterium sp. FZUC8N2.13]|uniref:VanZ family protein n=1 Tax=Flavobacterium zubiriense TaxID=3138075 RepID=A0ABV4TDU8_9FLAO
MSKKIVLFLLLIVIGIVFYFSWLTDPTLESETYLPKWLLNWSNSYYNLRTAVPFIAVGFLLEAYTQHMSSNKKNHNENSYFMQNLGIATIIVCIAEAGQFLIQKRNPDVMDVFFGILGSFIGGLGYYLVAMLMNSKKLKNAK